MSIIARVVAIIVWYVFVPVVFFVLYSVVEMQSACSDLSNSGSVRTSLSAQNLGQFRAMELARSIEAVEKWEHFVDKANNDQTLDNIKLVKLKNAAAMLSANWQALQNYNLGLLGKSPFPEGTALSYAQTNVIAYVHESHAKTLGSEDTLIANLVDAEAKYNNISELVNEKRDDIERRSEHINNINVDIVKQKVAIDQDPLAKIGYALADLDETPVGDVIKTLILMPSGAIIAVFTALVGCIGAVTASVAKEVSAYSRSRVQGDPATHDDLYRAYVVRPILGGLAGFTVYFVVSAGAGFLVRGSAQSHDGSPLSPSALASLGIFAGLASEEAIEWLRAAADSFFAKKPGDGNHRAAGPNPHEPAI